MFLLPRLAALTLLVLLPSVARGQTPNPDLPQARSFLEELRYAEAATALEAARARPGNDRATLLQILELQGVVAGMLRQPVKARTAFQMLLSLAPDHQLVGDYAPRVMTPYFEARGWVDEVGALRLESVPPVKTDAFVERLAVRLPSDPLKLGRGVRFHVRTDTEPWRQQEVALENAEASLPVKGGQVQWWVELLDEHQAVLATVGSAEAPLTEITVQAQALLDALKNRAQVQPRSPMRTTGYVLLGVAAGSGVAGGLFGLRSRSARAEVEDAPVDEQGRTIGLTQRQAQQLDDRARSSARLANVLFGVAGVAAVAGGTFWVLGAPVKVSASPAGVALEGTLP
ncbi:MAG TPA: hypothetical protein VF815_02950 [Myxococcaceae bacterium]